MADNARKTHVSPGVYSREIDIHATIKSLGITTLGLVGETLKGPAFEPISIESWADFQDVFGGTSTEKFKGTKFPKYELPYIAKSYLSQSKQLEVCRVLGLSGYNAGPAWAITADRGGKKMVVAVLRSRGYYKDYEKYEVTPDNCACGLSAHDVLHYYVGEYKQADVCTHGTHYNGNAVKLTQYVSLNQDGDECTSYSFNGQELTFGVNSNDYGHFTISGFTDAAEVADQESGSTMFSYPVSLNPADNDYILKVLGTNPHDGDAPLFVESLYDVALIQGIEAREITAINSELEFYDVYSTADLCTIPPVADFISKAEGALTRRDLGKRFLAVDDSTTCHAYDIETNECVDSGSTDSGWTASAGSPTVPGVVYTVKSFLDPTNKRHYYYSYFVDLSGATSGAVSDYIEDCVSYEGHANQDNVLTAITPDVRNNKVYNKSVLVKVNADGFYYRMMDGEVVPVTCDLNNYKSQYRYASTPWIVSNLKGDRTKVEMNKLFRFHTISDGNNANEMVKISIKNVMPDNGTFDVEIRDINDSDAVPQVLELYSKCDLTPGSNRYLGYLIGTYDGVYESKSKYVTVEINENTITRNSVPCGFLGYPLAQYNGYQAIGDTHQDIVSPYIKYNCDYDEDIKNRKQYFGLSDLVGVDIDMFTFKGNAAYTEVPESLSNGFHLDSRASLLSYYDANDDIIITVDGESGYTFDTVSVNNVTNTLQDSPIIATEPEMEGTIYEYTNLRKFTVFFYGGFDGWDEYRDSRSNTNDFKLSKYYGKYNSKTSEGSAFSTLTNTDALNLNQKGITSDWYAYLAGIRQFANPESVDINVFATPGIDYVNNQALVEEAIEMIEEERADSIYVVTTPDKPSGAEDYVDEMYTAEEAVENLEVTDIDSNYTCTYFPWVKYLDTDHNQYIYLPATKDVVRNMAYTDNAAQPWYAPAGLERGDVNCVRAHYITKLADEDALYEGRINPVKTFAQDGVKIWGQKNLQVTESQLNRIAVRRLLLRMRKLIAVACLGLIFEPNDATTKDTFLSIVTPIMDNIRANRGITDYKIEVDDSIEARQRLELPAKIFFKPINALEYIPIDFVITPEGVDFDSI